MSIAAAPLRMMFYTIGNLDLGLKAANHVCHGGDRRKLGFRGVGHTEFVGDQKTIYTPILKGKHVLMRMFKDLLYASAISRISGERIQMQQRNNRFF